MRAVARLPLVAALVLLVVSFVAGSAAADSAKLLRAASPAYMKSKEIRKRITEAGTDGVRMSTIRRWVRKGVAGKAAQQEPAPEPCPGVSPSERLQSNTCQTYPHGCTANFIYQRGAQPFPFVSDGRNHFIGTAGHCVDHANQPVFMQIGAAMVNVGRVHKRMNGGLGNDFASVRIHQGIALEPRTPVGGPQGVYTGCQPQVVKFWGHGFGLFVGPGKPGGGLATNWFDRSYGFTGEALPGDSGSGVLVEGSEEAAGDLTHLIVDSRYPASDVAGTRQTRILTFLGGNYYQVNEDGTLARNTMSDTRCGNANNGSRLETPIAVPQL
jgi:hypothetical protein